MTPGIAEAVWFKQPDVPRSFRAADDTLCLPSSLRPGECSPSLDHDSGILEDYRHGLDWDAAVAARRAFLAQCPAATGNPSTHTSPETQKRGIV
ncbi:TrbM/KikA/MpfK family conjugal transfer protein [Castellaniella ginsengisoli]|uniref:TrbM/KikA/MpfK family conjugal transfer protein n=1 Tax=Castellaniella ginsengisoli TaxID=546114 RepID=A0AB39DAR9_9BURK